MSGVPIFWRGGASSLEGLNGGGSPLITPTFKSSEDGAPTLHPGHAGFRSIRGDREISKIPSRASGPDRACPREKEHKRAAPSKRGLVAPGKGYPTSEQATNASEAAAPHLDIL